MKPILANYFGISWEQWTLNPENEQWIVNIAKKLALFYAFAALYSLFYLTSCNDNLWFKRLGNLIMSLGLLNLLLLYFLYTKDKSYRPTEFLEYALQWSSPLLLIFYKNINLTTLKLLCASVFIAHGLYAHGIYPTPVSYYNMTMNSLQCSQLFAKNFLNIIGMLDFIAAIGLFWSKSFKISVIYMIIWGAMTTVARLYGNWHQEMWELTIQQYFHEMLVRFPHFLLPLALFYVEKITLSET
jgi:hypothetical protein